MKQSMMPFCLFAATSQFPSLFRAKPAIAHIPRKHHSVNSLHDCTERERDRQTDRQTEGETDRQRKAERERNRETERETVRDRDRNRETETGRQTERHSDGDRQRDRQTPTDRQTEKQKQRQKILSLWANNGSLPMKKLT